jgi:tape measure domain-containing protein
VSVVANVAINVDASGALAALRAVENAANQVAAAGPRMATALGGAMQGLGGKVSELGRSMSSLAGLAATIGAGAAVGGFVKAGVEADRTQKKIAALTDAYKEAPQVNAIAKKAANDFGIGQTKAANAVSDLYGRLRPMGVSLNDIGTTFNGVNKAALMMNLSTADTEGVLLQLSQAMGSGALQGDELRSIMERLPMIGQAVARTMGVTVGEVKQLGADGKITTDVIVKALQDLNKIQPPPPDPYKLFQKAIEDLNTAIGQQLLPVFTPLVQKITELVDKFKELEVGKTIAEALLPLGQALLGLVDGFLKLDPGTQKFIIQLGVIVGALALVVVPLGIFLSTLGTIISVVGSVISTLAGLSIFATIAGWLGALGPVAAGIVAVLTGPVGIVIAIGVVIAAIYVFRDKISAAFEALGRIFLTAAEAFYNTFIKPIIDWNLLLLNKFNEVFTAVGQAVQTGFSAAWQYVKTTFIDPVTNAIKSLYDGIVSTFNKLPDVIKAPFVAAFSTIRGVVNQILNGIGSAIRSVVQSINNVIGGANGALARLRLPQIPFLPVPNIPQFANGGVVTKPTLAMVGEGGQPEYIVPQSKAANFAQNYIGGKRGASAINSASSGSGGGGTATQVSIQTGPVVQMNGANYVTTQQMSMAVKEGIDQAMRFMSRDLGIRRSMGMA